MPVYDGRENLYTVEPIPNNGEKFKLEVGLKKFESCDRVGGC